MFKYLKQDIPASFVVFFVALPLCLGIAVASGASPFSGLIAGIVGGIVVGSISNSPLGVSGPAAGLTVLVLTGIQTLGDFQAFLLAVVLAGVFQVILAIVRAGVIGYFFPSSVIKGMLAAIGIIIILKQIPHALGDDKDPEGDMNMQQPDGENTFTEIISAIQDPSAGVIIVSVISLIIIISWDKMLVKKVAALKMVPSALIAVIFGVLYEVFTPADSSLAIAAEHLVQVPVAGSVSEWFGFFQFPSLTYLNDPRVYQLAFTLGLVASLETLLSVEAIDKLDPKKRVTHKNRELLAQGAGNIVSGLIGGIPVTQVIVRSSANVQSGGQTKLSTILHGTLLLLCVIAIPTFLNMIPIAVLACVLLLVGYKLTKPSLFIDMYRAGWSQFVPFVITVAGVVFTDLLKGIIMGLVAAVLILLRNSYKNSHFLHIEEQDSGNHVVKMTLAEEVTFLNKGAVRDALNKLPDGSEITIDMSKSFKVDSDVLEIIEDFKTSAQERNIRTHIIDQDNCAFVHSRNS